MTTQHKRGIDKGGGFDGTIADITQPTSHMPTVEASLTESLKGIKEPQISAQDPQENLIKQDPPSKIRKRLSSPHWWIIQCENTEDREDHFPQQGPGPWE